MGDNTKAYVAYAYIDYIDQETGFVDWRCEINHGINPDTGIPDITKHNIVNGDNLLDKYVNTNDEIQVIVTIDNDDDATLINVV